MKKELLETLRKAIEDATDYFTKTSSGSREESEAISVIHYLNKAFYTLLGKAI